MATAVGCLVILLVSTVPALAAPPVAQGNWEKVWSYDFENPHLRGWEAKSFSNTDYWKIRPGIGRDDSKGLWTCSARAACGAGYSIQSPSFQDMGVDVTKPYVIQLDYSPIHGSWTYALVSSFVSLVVKDCENGCAKLGWVDENHMNFTPVANLAMDTFYPEDSPFYLIEVVVMPSAGLDQASFVIYVDGQFKAMGTRGINVEYRGVGMVDLPGVPWDPATQDMPQVQCCGGGRWDNVAVFQLADEPQPPARGERGIEVRCDPNPFNPATRIQFELPKANFVRLDIFDVAGRRVRTLCNEMRDAGTHTLVWRGVDESGASVASGAYLARIAAGGETATFRLTLVR
jgi:hypothetical protein